MSKNAKCVCPYCGSCMFYNSDGCFHWIECTTCGVTGPNAKDDTESGAYSAWDAMCAGILKCRGGK